MALDTINKCLSDAVCAFSHGRLDGDSRTAGLVHSGNEILETYKYYPEVRLLQYSAFPHVLLLVIDASPGHCVLELLSPKFYGRLY